MPRRGNTAYRIIIAAVFIILEAAAVVMLAHNGTLQNTWLMKGAHGFMAAVWGGTEAVRDYFSLRKENDRLAEKNHRLEKEISR